MKTKLILSLAIIAIIFGACKKDDDEFTGVACFSVQNTGTILVGDEIKLSNCSQNALFYLWDFGDGTTSTEKEPNHTYNDNGNYEIKLAVQDEEFTDITGDGKINMSDCKYTGELYQSANSIKVEYTNKQLLILNKWKTIAVKDVYADTVIYKNMETSCERDDIWNYKENGNLEVTTGEIRCFDGQSAGYTINYLMNDKQDSIFITDGGEDSIKFKVNSLSKEKLEYEITHMTDEGKLVIHLTDIPAND